MTVSTTTNRISYAGNASTTAFATGFKFYANGDLTVTLVTDSTGAEVVKVITTDYTVANAGVDSGGTVTMVTAPATGETLVIERTQAYTQPMDLVENDPFPSNTVEQQLDRMVIMTQQNNSALTRSLRQPDGDTADIDKLPVKVTRATKVLAFDSDGDPVASTSTLADIEDGATDAAASAAAALISANAAAADLVLTNADVVLTNAEVVSAAAEAAAAAVSAASAAASAAGIYWKAPVLVSSTANLTLSGAQTIDGISAVADDRVLVKDQTATEENGIYIVAAGAWSRAIPMDTWDEHVGAVVLVSQGSLGENKAYQCTVNAGGTLGTTAITWASFGAVAIDFVVDTFVDVTDYTSGTTTALTLSAKAGSEQNITVTFDGVTQHHNQFSLSGTTLTFTEAIPLGVDSVEVKLGSSLGIGTPSDGTVTEAKIADDAVTTAKVLDGAITSAKLAAGAASDTVARDMAASAMALILANTDANQNGAVGPFWLTDDFESDNLTTKTNATYNAAGDYYSSPSINSTPSASGLWSGATANYTFSGSDVLSTANDRHIYFTTGQTGDVYVEFTYNETSIAGKAFGWGDTADIGSFASTNNGGNNFGGMANHSCFCKVNASGVVSVFANNTSGTTEAGSPVTLVTNDIVRLQRNGSDNVLLYVNGALEYTWTATRTGSQTFIISNNGGSGTINFDSLSINVPGTPANMTLAPTAVTVTTANPTDILGYVVIDPQEAITVGTDIVMTASIDGGTTDATGSWTKVGDVGTTELYRVEFDVSAQTGSSLTYEITTANAKEIRYNASVGLVPLY